MNSFKNLYDFIKTFLESVYIFDGVTVSLILERFIVGLLLFFVALNFIVQGFNDFILFQKLFILLIFIHSLQGIYIILDDYIKHKYSNELFRSFLS